MTGVQRRALLALLALLAAVGCGGGSSSESGKQTLVTTRDMPGYGTVLTTEAGDPLYLLSADPKGGSKCAASCAKDWRPLTGGEPAADGKVEESMLATFKRSDGGQQVLYNGHALYTTTGEQLAGVGTKALGGTWWLVSPKGEAVKTTSAGAY